MVRRPFPASLLLLALLVGGLRADNAQEAYRLIQEAEKLDKESRYAEALEATKKAIALNPKEPHYHGAAGYYCWKLEKYGEGLGQCERAIKLAFGKKDAWYLFMAGENAYADLDVAAARDYFERALARGEKELGTNVAATRGRLAALTRKDYEFEWALDPSKFESMKRPDGTILVPLPSTRWLFQKTTYMSVSGARAHKKEDFEANESLALTPEGTSIIRIRLRVSVEPYSYKDKFAQRIPDGPLPAIPKTYLKQSEWIDPESKQLKKIVHSLRREDSLDTVREIVKYMRGRMRYIHNANLVNPGDVTAETVLDRGQASCHGWSAAFTALCRTAGIPARMVLVLYAKAPDRLEFHDIAEVYIPGSRWVAIEPQPGGLIGFPGTEYIRLYHYVPGRKWRSRDPAEIHPASVLMGMMVDPKPMYNLAK